jgi:tetratricopeptide (TPR) repeat protein
MIDFQLVPTGKVRHLQHSTPAAPAVRETLERLLASETFARSERARNLLRYLVEREQAGEADRLKGFAIAMDVFGKDADFDSATDAVVRVQAGRLRELLQQYFSTEGVNDPIRIIIPRGSYVPIYETNSAPASLQLAKQETSTPPPMPAVAHGQATPSPVMRQIQLVWLAIGLVVAVLAGLILRQGSPGANSMALTPGIEASVATGSIDPDVANETLPVVYLAVTAQGPEVDRVAAAMRAGLSAFDTVDFIGRDLDEGRDRSSDGTAFVFELRPGPAPGDVTIELQNVATGRVLFSRNLALSDTRPPAVEVRVAGLLSATAPASGAIYAAIRQSGQHAGLVHCLLLNEAYYLDQNAGTHEAAYRCLESLAERNAKSSLVYSELSALHLEAVTDRYPYPPHATLDQAMALAHKAVQQGPTSPSAHRAYGYLIARAGRADEAIRWMRKAHELNTYDLSMAAAYAYGLIFAGNYAEGTPIIAMAVDAYSGHPTWWDFGLFLGAFMQGDLEQAQRAAANLRTTAAKSHYLAARLITAKMAGDEKARNELLAELTANFPLFAADPRKTFRERNYPSDLIDRLVGALRDAGLGGAT